MGNLDQTTKHLPFDKAVSPRFAETEVSDPASNTMALVIDAQDFSNMDAEDAQNYADQLAETLASLRTRGIPVTWVTMWPGARLFEPDNSGAPPQARDADQLRKLGFHGIDHTYIHPVTGEECQNQNVEIYRDFILKHGPRTDETVSVKSIKSALVEQADADGKPEYQAALVAECGEELSAYFGSQERTLADYMRDRGVENTVIMGAVSSHCVAETAVSAAIKGFKPYIVTDRVLSWQGEEDQIDPRTSLLLWHGTDNDQVAFDAYHQGKITTKISEIASDQNRGFTSAQMTAISNTDFTTSAILAQKFETNRTRTGLINQPEVT